MSRWFIRTALLYLLISLLLGVVQPWLPSAIPIPAPTYVHLLVVGWLTQLIFGVAYWMFPKQRGNPPVPAEPLAWGTYLCLNLGLVLRVAFESGWSTTGPAGWLVVSAVLQLAAGWAFVISAWPRVRGK